MDTRTATRALFIDDLRSSGFGVIRQAVPGPHVVAMRKRLDALFEQSPPAHSNALQRILSRLVERDPRFLDVALHPELIAALQQIFTATPHLVCSYGHEKPAGTEAHTGPHSDVAHLPGVHHDTSTLMLKVMMALTPVGADNGPTMLYPGTHRGEPAGAGIPVTLEPGDLLLFHANIRHTATANRSDIPRLGLWYVFALPWMRPFPGYEFSTGFLDSLRPRLSAEPHLRWIFGLEDPYATRPTT